MRGVEPAAPVQSQTMTPAQAERASQRPEWAPEKFWKADTGEVDYENLGKSYSNLEKLIGRDKVPVPLGDDDAEGWDRFYKASGRPESADKYEFKRPDKLPDGLNYDEDLEKAFREQAHIAGLNPKQAGVLYERYVQTQIDRNIAYSQMKQQERAKVEQDLRREFGAQFDAKIARAKEAMGMFADPEYRQYLEESGQGNDPRAIRAWIKVGEQIGGETKLKGAPQQTSNPVNMEKAIGEFRTKNQTALFDRAHPDHDRLVKELNAMYEKAYE